MILRRAVLARASALACAALVVAPGCAALQQAPVLRAAVFTLSGISDVRIAGIALGGAHHYADLGAIDVARLGAAVAERRVPLAMTLHVAASNPLENHLTAHLVGLEWTLFLDGTRTASGSANSVTDMPAGETVDIPLAVDTDLAPLFAVGARELFDLALGLAGQGGTAHQVRLDLLPTVQTPAGAVRYPQPIVISRRVGGTTP